MIVRIAPGPALRVARAAGGALTIAAVGALLWRAAADGAALQASGWTLRPVPLVASLALETAVLASGVWLWRRLLAGATGAAVAYSTLLATWWRTSVSRYLPGRVWPFVAAELAREPDVRRGAMAATLAAHAGLALVAALLVGVAFGRDLVGGDLVATKSASLARVAPTSWVAVGALLAIAGVALAIAGRRRVAARMDGAAIAALRAVLSPRLVLLHAASWVAHGVALFVFAAAVLPVPPSLPALSAIIGAGALASGAGTLLGVAPAGLGVREAVLGALLATQLPLGAAMLLAIAARPWATAAELLLGVAVAASRMRSAARPADAVAAGAR